MAKRRYCEICKKYLVHSDFNAAVDHMYKKHNAKSDVHAKQMARMNTTYVS